MQREVASALSLFLCSYFYAANSCPCTTDAQPTMHPRITLDPAAKRPPKLCGNSGIGLRSCGINDHTGKLQIGAGLAPY